MQNVVNREVNVSREELVDMLRRAIGKDHNYLYTAIRGKLVLLDKTGSGFYVNQDGSFGEGCYVDVGIIDNQPVLLATP